MSSAAAMSASKHPEGHREHALRARAARRDAAEQTGVDAAFIDRFVEEFYARIREDDMLGPIFDEHVADWPPHLARMKAFWRSILHNSGEFSGRPMATHLAIPGLEARHFERWLTLFYATLREIEQSPEATALVGGRARMIAESLLTGIAMQRDGIGGAKAGRYLPHA